jgi:hypothetical protein
MSSLSWQEDKSKRTWSFEAAGLKVLIHAEEEGGFKASACGPDSRLLMVESFDYLDEAKIWCNKALRALILNVPLR